VRASPSRPPCRAARAGSEGAGRGQVLTRRPLDEIRHHAAAADGELDAHWKGLAATAARGAGALAGACLSAAPLCDALNALGSALEAELKALRLDEGALGEHPLFCDAEVASPRATSCSPCAPPCRTDTGRAVQAAYRLSIQVGDELLSSADANVGRTHLSLGTLYMLAARLDDAASPRPAPLRLTPPPAPRRPQSITRSMFLFLVQGASLRSRAEASAQAGLRRRASWRAASRATSRGLGATTRASPGRTTASARCTASRPRRPPTPPPASPSSRRPRQRRAPLPRPPPLAAPRSAPPWRGALRTPRC